MHTELKELGIQIGRERVARLMKEAGLEGVSRRKKVITTHRDSEARSAPDLVDRDFRAAGRVVVGDRAAFVRNTFDELLPGATWVHERCHVKQHLVEAATTTRATDDNNRQCWLTARLGDLDQGEAETLINRLMLHAQHCNDARACADYFRRDRRRLRYADFHAAGLCTSTGVLEAGCNNSIGTRLKRPGMH